MQIFEEENKIFYDKICIDKTFLIWDTFKSKPHIKRDLYFTYSYYKYKSLVSKSESILFKQNYLNKKKYMINFYNLYKKCNNTRQFFKNKYFISQIMINLSLFSNRNKLLKLIYFRRKKFDVLIKTKETLFFQNKNILDSKNEKILYIFFLISFLLIFTRKNNINEHWFMDLKQRIFKLKKLKKKNFLNFKFMFFLSNKLSCKFNINVNPVNDIFLFSFFFIILEKKFFKSIELHFYNYDKIFKIDFIQEYFFEPMYNFLLDYVLEILSENFAKEVDNYYSKRYDILYHTLKLKYKKYWIKVNKKFLKKVKKKEKYLLEKLNSLKFFFSNKYYLKKLYDIYILFKYDFWTLFQYKNLMVNQLKWIDLLLNFKKRKINKLNLKKRFKFFKKKKMEKNYIFSFILLLLKKIKKIEKITYINWNLMYKLYCMFDKKIFMDLFKIVYFTSLNVKWKLNNYTKKIPFFLKINFGIINVFFRYLEKEYVLNYTKLVRKFFYCYCFIFLIEKLKIKKNNNYLKIKNNNYLKIKNTNYFFLMFLVKKRIKKILKKKKKNLKEFGKINTEFILTYNNNIKFSWFLILDKVNYLKKKSNLVASLDFFLKVKINLYKNFLFFFKQNLLQDVILNVNYNLIIYGYFFDLMNDYKFFKTKWRKKILFFSGDTIYWSHIKTYLHWSYLKILINRRVVFGVWFEVLNKYVDNRYKDDALLVDDDLFILYLYELDYFELCKINLYNTRYKIELRFLVKLFIAYINFVEIKTIDQIQQNSVNLKILERNLINNQFYIESYRFFIKKFFFNIISLKKKFIKKKLLVYHKNLIISKNLYFKNNLRKKNIINFKITFLNLQKKYIVCNKCLDLCTDIYSVKLIKYYQKFLKLNLLNKNILKFNFKFCNKCSGYKICLNRYDSISFFLTYKDILKNHKFNNNKINIIYISKFYKLSV